MITPGRGRGHVGLARGCWGAGNGVAGGWFIGV